MCSGLGMLNAHRSSAQPRSLSDQRPWPNLTTSRSHTNLTLRVMSSAESRSVTFNNQKGQKLAGILTTVEGQTANTTTDANSKCVILCHGYTSHKNGFHFPALADALANTGFNSIRFDFRGNCDSEGTFRLAGYLDEVEDIAAAKQYLEQQQGQQVIALLGKQVFKTVDIPTPSYAYLDDSSAGCTHM
eukprot:GHUV01021437.1.p1 GENE.GHUV01021437.1~~GHUV01021437.1.p1  ORF type:complete len:188 (+),score=17.09 GHUV01021437.1:104-667(+)